MCLMDTISSTILGRTTEPSVKSLDQAHVELAQFESVFIKPPKFS